MLRQALERRTGHLEDTEFKELMEIVTDDLKFNRVNFKKCTNLDYVLSIAIRSVTILKKCA